MGDGLNENVELEPGQYICAPGGSGPGTPRGTRILGPRGGPGPGTPAGDPDPGIPRELQ